MSAGNATNTPTNTPCRRQRRRSATACPRRPTSTTAHRTAAPGRRRSSPRTVTAATIASRAPPAPLR
jgi:hypothetical protein